MFFSLQLVDSSIVDLLFLMLWCRQKNTMESLPKEQGHMFDVEEREPNSVLLVDITQYPSCLSNISMCSGFYFILLQFFFVFTSRPCLTFSVRSISLTEYPLTFGGLDTFSRGRDFVISLHLVSLLYLRQFSEEEKRIQVVKVKGFDVFATSDSNVLEQTTSGKLQKERRSFLWGACSLKCSSALKCFLSLHKTSFKVV